MRPPAVLAAVCALALPLAGCGDDDAADQPSRSDDAAELERLRTEIAKDAERRGGRPVLRVRCEPTTRSDPPPGSLDCLAVTDETPPSDTIPVPVVLGQPYAARIDPATGRGAWCRVEPVAGEGATPSPEEIEALPPRCGGDG